MLQSFIFGITLYVKSRLHNGYKHLAITVIILALYLGWVLKYDFGFQAMEPRLQHLPMVLIWGIGPSFYAYIRYQLGRPFKKKELFLHYLPVLIELIIFLLVHYLVYFHVEWVNRQENILGFFCKHHFGIDHIIGLISMFVYLAWSWILVKSFPGKGSLLPIKLLLFAFGLIWLVWLPYTIYDTLYFNFGFPPSKFYLFYLILAILSYMLGFIGFRVKKMQQQNSDKTWTREDARDLDRLINYLEKEECYLDSNLNVQVLGEKLGWHSNRISFLVNKGLQCGFRDFINKYRVEALKEKLTSADNSMFTILSLGYDCGFNSKASINRIFKTQVGLSPHEFRKNSTQNAF